MGYNLPVSVKQPGVTLLGRAAMNGFEHLPSARNSVSGDPSSTPPDKWPLSSMRASHGLPSGATSRAISVGASRMVWPLTVLLGQPGKERKSWALGEPARGILTNPSRLYSLGSLPSARN